MNVLSESDRGDLQRLETFVSSHDMPSGRKGSVKIHLSQHYRIVEARSLSGDLRSALAPLIDRQGFQAFLLPEGGAGGAILPLDGEKHRALTRIERGCTWNEAEDLLSVGAVEKLLTNGLFSARLGDIGLTGPAVPVVMRFVEGRLNQAILTSDPLSRASISYVSRFVDIEPKGLARRLYRYNTHDDFGSASCAAISDQIAVQVPSIACSRFAQVDAPSANPGWWFFENRAARAPSQKSFTYKLYVSPTPKDTVRCIETVSKVLSASEATAWKIGRGSYGIARPDKICIYFNHQHEAAAVAQVLRATLSTIEAQGVPFTRRYDQSGLVTEGIDPPRSVLVDGHEGGTSWRVWISEKIAQGLRLARSHSDYPLSPELSALWTMKLLGIDPENWQATNTEFWRN